MKPKNKKRVAILLLGAMLATTVLSIIPNYSMDEDVTISQDGEGTQLSKTLTVNLTKDYKECTFTVTFTGDDFEADSITLMSPDNKSYDFEPDSVTGAYSCKVQSVKEGDWTATITKTFGTDVSEPTIPKATLSVKTSDTTTKDVTGDIKIAKEITGLKYYWKDDAIVTEWTDDSVGNVNVRVTDAKTLQVLGEKTVQDKYYECEIDPSVQQIILLIVPSTSSGITGAEVQYVVNNDYNPDASVKFDEDEYVNTDTSHAVVSLGEEYDLVYYDNGNADGGEDNVSAGDTDIEVPITEGRNDILVYVVDEDGNMKSFSHSVVRDTVPPVLKVESDITDTTIYNSTVEVKGNVSDYATLRHGTRDIEVDDLGDFDDTINLKEGVNTVTITATDEAGNVTEYTAEVTMLVKQKKSIPFQIVIPLLIVAGGCVAILFIKKRREEQYDEEEEFVEKPKKQVKKEKKVKTEKPKKKSKRTKTDKMTKLDWIHCGILAICCGVIVFCAYFVLRPMRCMSGSMKPTIMTGEYGLVDMIAYRNREPQRGDIISFHSDEYDKEFMKRVIGIGGDEITFHNGYVYINGIVCDESAYLDEDIETNCTKTFTVPEGTVFVLGDNRENSNDARYWDNPYISIDSINGKVLWHTDAVIVLKEKLGIN